MTIALQLTGQNKDLGGGFIVHRLLPDAQNGRQSVPSCFLSISGLSRLSRGKATTSSRKERMVPASSDWAAQAIGHAKGDAEFIPFA